MRTPRSTPRKVAAFATVGALVLGAGPAFAEPDEGDPSEVTASIIINVTAEPLEISIDAEDTTKVWDFIPGQTDIDYDMTGTVWDVDVRTSSGSEKAKITQFSPGLDDPTILNDLVIESALYIQGNVSAEGTAANKLFFGMANPCGYSFVFKKDSPSGPRERLGCRGMNPGFNSISGSDATTLELEIYGYLDGTKGPTQRGTIQIDYTWIIEAYPDDEEPSTD
jgi:hypothetical protein